jgi:hypothetical protein
MVKPNQNYQLAFAIRTKELVTGGLPVITVTDVKTEKRLACPPLFQLRQKVGKIIP